MATPRDAAAEGVLTRLLEEHGLGRDRSLYREVMREQLDQTATPGVFRLAANPRPSESVTDVYGPGYVVQAEDLGPGLAFAEAASPNWQETMELRTLKSLSGISPQDRVEVEVKLGELLAQGGLMYPVESVTVERAWYFTLPRGSVEVRLA
jgi:hypothetical protein